MKKHFFAIAFLIFVLGVILFILLMGNKEERSLEITTIIDTIDNYKCDVNIKDENIVKYVKNYSLNDKENLNDEKSHINFVFEGLNPGKTVITIKCLDTKSNQVLKEEIHKVMVNKKLETSIYILEK